MKRLGVYFLILFFSAVVLIPFTGNVHLFDWDEINFAECAREMIVTNSFHTPLINFQAFWEKPPLFIWMQILSMKLFGINELAARFPNIINGIITLCLLYYFGKRWYSPNFGILWAVIHLGTFLPHFYFRSGIIDPWYNLFGFIFFAGWIEFIKNKNKLWIFIGSVSLALAILTKGPAILLIFLMSILITLFFFKIKISANDIKAILLSIFIFLLTGSSWFIFEYISGNEKVVFAFIEYQIRLLKTEDSGHGGFLLYHFIVILIGCFPASILMLQYFSKKIDKDIISKCFAVLLFVVLVIFSIVKTKIVHYSSLTYYSVSFLTAYVLQRNFHLFKFQKILLLVIAFFIGTVLILAGTMEQWKQLIIPYLNVTDKFAAENLKTQVNWYGFEFLSGLFIVAISVWYLKIKNYTFKYQTSFFILLIIWINFTINNFVGKVEQYTQNSAVIFFEWCADHHWTVDTYGYKSYANLFYGKRMPATQNEQITIEKYLKNLENAGYEKQFSYNLAYLNWLLYDDKKYHVFLVCKIQDEKNPASIKKFRKLYSKGGYTFFMKQHSTR